jgi:DNA replication licensing factor MCM3
VEQDKRTKRRKMATFDSDSSDDDSDSDNGGDDEETSARATSTATPGRRSTRARPTRGAASSAAFDEESESQTTRTQTQTDSQMSVASSHPASQLLESQGDESQPTAQEITPVRFALFRQTLGPLMGTRVFVDGDQTNVNDMIEAINTAIRASPNQGAGHVFSRAEAIQALRKMNDENLLM